MSMVKWDPLSNIATLQDRINRLFDDAFPRTAQEDEEMAAYSWRPLVDIYDTESGAVLKMDLPGMDKSDVAVEIKENVLTIKGERPSDSPADDAHYYRRERSSGKFQRSFAMRSMIAPDQIKASFRNGVLTIQIPKPVPQKSKQVTVTTD